MWETHLAERREAARRCHLPHARLRPRPAGAALGRLRRLRAPGRPGAAARGTCADPRRPAAARQRRWRSASCARARNAICCRTSRSKRAADGQPQRVLGTVFDVTELRRAERSARLAAERMEIATRLGGLSVFERDAQDRFIHFDGMLAALYGVQPGQPAPPISESIERVLPEDRERYVAARARMRAADDPVRCEYRARAADGSVRDLLSWRRRASTPRAPTWARSAR
ncbi:MAG: PAS domain-containing protein [Rhodopseudomonas palustris]|nr:PAS domain-containing protein [Rhodopseudomonas palustris]